MKLTLTIRLIFVFLLLIGIKNAPAQTSCTDPSIPIVAPSANVVCPGTNVDLTIVSGNLNDAANWNWYTSSCGGILAGVGSTITVNPTSTTTYFARGEGGCVTPGPCASMTITVLPDVTLNVKLFIQGFYLGSGSMVPYIYNSLGSPYGPTDVDELTIELHDAMDPCILIASYQAILQTDGTVQVPIGCQVSGGNYYISVKHRSSIETWSAAPVNFNGTVFYDFSTQQSQAYCDNQVDVLSEGIWSIYSGDFNQDGLINECDEAMLNNDITNFLNGYVATDINGDGVVDAFDLILFEQNLPLAIGMCSPCSSAQPFVVCPILGTKVFCEAAADEFSAFSISTVAGATQYNWTVPNGMSIVGGQGTNSINVFWPASAVQNGILGVICVSVTTPCGIAECCDSIKISVPPNVDLGPDIVLCNPGDCTTLSSTPISNVKSYSWSTLPGFVSIPSTAGAITVCPTISTCYALIVETLTGCVDTDTVCVQVEPMTLTCTGTNISCNGTDDGSVCVTYSCITSPYTISWTRNGVLEPTFQSLCQNGLKAGTYCITITTSSGAMQTCCYEVTEPDPLSINVSVFDATICDGLGSFTITPSGGTAPYTVGITPCPSLMFNCTFSTTFGFSTLQEYPAGTYIITITDANGCTLSVTKTLHEPITPQIVATAIPPLCCGSNGHFDALISGGTGPFTIVVTTNSVTNPIPVQTYVGITGNNFTSPNDLPAGSYILDLTDALGCQTSVIIDIIDPPCLNFEAIPFNSQTCGGLGSFSFIPSGGTSPYTFTTNPCPVASYPCSITNPTQFLTLQKYPANVYTITCTDDHGCTASVVRTISEPAPPQITVDVVNPLCCGDSGRFVVHITSGTGPYTVRLLSNSQPYSILLQTYFGITGPLFSSPPAERAGSYIVDVIDANGCFDSQVITFVDPPCLELHYSTSGFPGLTCDGHISLYGSGGTPFNTNYHVPYSMFISQIQGNSPAIGYSESGDLSDVPFYDYADRGCNGTYLLSVTDSNGCRVTDTLRMDCNFRLDPPAGVPTTTCIRASEDAQIGQLSPNSNYGSHISLRASRWTYSGIWATVRSYFKFDIGSIPSNSFLSAGLSLSTCPSCTPFDHHDDLSNPPLGNASIISGVSAAWNENTITWNNAPVPNAITDAVTSLGNQTTVGLNADVTNIVQNWISTGVNDGLMIRLADDPAFPINYYHQINFASRENADTNIHPKLCITYLSPVVTICSGSSVPITAPLIAGVNYKWYTVPGYLQVGTGNVLTVNPSASQQYAVIAIAPSGCRDTNFVQVNVATSVDDGDECTNDYCLDGIVYHTRFISCTCPASCSPPYTLSQNLIVNGNFSNGNTGFTSELPFLNACGSESYGVGNNARVKCVNFLSVTDNTTGSGTGNDNFLIVDGREAAPTVVWEQGVGNIMDGRSYTFSFAIHPRLTSYVYAKPNISIMLGTQTVLTIPGNTLNNNWNTFCLSFTSTQNAQNAKLRIIQTNQSLSLGYDYGIDDIVFKKCKPRIYLDDAVIVNASCVGHVDGSISVVPIGGTPPYTYDWGGLGTSATLSNVSSGTYTVTVTDATGDVSTATYVVENLPPLVVTATVTTPILCYNGDGCVEITATGGTPPYIGTGTTCLMSAGTYFNSVLDANGCFTTVQFMLTQPPKLEVTTSTVSSTCGIANGSATANASGGTPPYSYQWNTNPVQTGATVVNLPPGVYSVVVTDANGCSRTDFVTIEIYGNEPAVPGPIFGPGGACRNQVNLLYSVSPVAGATSYGWTLPPGVTGSSNSNTINLSFSNSYSGGFICVAAQNSCGTSSNSCMSIPVITTYPAVPNPIAGPSIVCGPSTVTYSTTSYNALSYNWTVTGGATIQSGQGTNTVVVSVPAGFAQGAIQVSATNCFGNSAVRGSLITGIPTHSYAVSGPSYACANTSAIFTMPVVTGATSYLWSVTGDASLGAMSVSSSTVSQVINFGPSWTSGTISVSAVNSCGSYTKSFVVRSTPIQPGSITGPASGLCNTTATYSVAAVPSATSYQWSVPAGASIFGSSTGSTVTVVFGPAFTLSSANICVSAVNGCGSGPQRCLAITSRPAAPVVSGSTSVCKSQNSVPYSIVPVSGATSYLWQVTGGASLTSSGVNAIVNYTTASIGSVIVRATGVNSCGSGSPGLLNVGVNLSCKISDLPKVLSEFEVFPNPTTGELNLKIDAGYNGMCIVKITDLLGNSLLKKESALTRGENILEFNLSDFAGGMYFLTVEGEALESRTVRIMVE